MAGATSTLDYLITIVSKRFTCSVPDAEIVVKVVVTKEVNHSGREQYNVVSRVSISVSCNTKPNTPLQQADSP
jgi:hypothetical protein